MELKELGHKIKELRTAKNLSAYELSLRVGKDTSYFYKVEKGEVNISYTLIKALCEVLEIKPEELF